MSAEPLKERIETALQELTGQGARISITAVAARAGIPRSSLYRNAQARELIARRIAETHLHADMNLAAEVTRLRILIETLAARVRNQEERLRHLEGRPHTTPR
ncbi:DUF6262 family protein [Paeniglutamicibacter cryotolerans]|uniref:AcrR family transcriptional regulator n=1 Tax=Paeniglutamicibacter cryotolerans TaxID=670079 RepID=A0A839QN85_9MICC|nr:DUF6262 family protein [Paeniglutamicibacter cryotolerans]MBB2996234.1 AcrR family transcriptional regulator [Paeniglutamicibacter cryotolerans]